jgi:hypothetical protein
MPSAVAVRCVAPSGSRLAASPDTTPSLDDARRHEVV